MDRQRLPQHLLYWFMIIVAGSGYGLVGYAIFSKLFSGEGDSGVMLASFLIGIPFSGSATVGYLMANGKRAGLGKILTTCLGVILIGMLLSVPIFGEGSICIVLFAGIAVVPCLLGAALGSAIGVMIHSVIAPIHSYRLYPFFFVNC